MLLKFHYNLFFQYGQPHVNIPSITNPNTTNWLTLYYLIAIELDL
jgi:hypothetical protein